MTTIRRGTVLSFDPTTWTALVFLDGADVESQIPVGQWIPSAMMTASAEVAVLVFGDTNTDDGIVLGPYGALGLQDLNTAASPTFAKVRAGSGANAIFGSLDITGATNNSVTSWAALSANPNGLLIAADITNGYIGIFAIAQGLGLTALISDPSTKYSTTAGTAGRHNVYISAGVPTIENKTGGTVRYGLYLFGFGT